LSSDWNIAEVKNASEEWFSCGPLDYLFFWEEQQAEGKGNQENQLEKIDPDGIQ